jgi:hypothetical protein
MTFDQFPFARTSIRQYHAIMAISALKPTRIQLPWSDPPTLLPLVVQIIPFVPGSDGASRPFSVTQLRIRNGSSCPIPAIGSPSTRTPGRVAFGHSAVNAGAVTTAHASSSSASIVKHSRSCRLTARLAGVAVYLLLSRPEKSKKIYLSICARLVNT